MELEECQLPLKNGCNQSLIAKSIPIVKEFSSQEWPINPFIIALSGMMLEHYKEVISEELSTSFTEAAHARDSVLQGLEKAWQMSEADYFSKLCAWPKKSSPHSYSLKTFQPSQQEGDFKLLEKLPKWGMIVDGVLYPQHPLEHRIKGIGGSYWLTPTTMDHLPIRTGEALENALHRGKEHKSRRKVSGRLNEQVAYPYMWPTPDASARGAYKSQEKRKGHHYTLQDAVGTGKLNPQWVELLMGYPPGWTKIN